MSRHGIAGRLAGLAAAALAVAASPAWAQSGQVKIAVIDVQRIITDSAAGKAALAQLEQYGKEQEGRLNAKKEELDQLNKRIADGRLSLAAEKLAELQKEAESKTIDLRRASDDAQREFNQRQAKALQEIERRVMPIITQVGKEGAYTMILRKFDSGLVYAADGIDITPAVIQRLDSAPAAAAPAGT